MVVFWPFLIETRKENYPLEKLKNEKEQFFQVLANDNVRPDADCEFFQYPNCRRMD